MGHIGWNKASLALLSVGVVTLAGCGPNATESGGADSPSGTAATVTMCLPPASYCPAGTSCETPSEEAAGQTIVHSSTIPDAALAVDFNLTLTLGPADSSTITEAQAEAAAMAVDGRAPAQSAVLAEEHDASGFPVQGQLVWVVDVTPGTPTSLEPAHAGSADVVRYAVVLVSATSGQVVEARSFGVPAAEGASATTRACTPPRNTPTSRPTNAATHTPMPAPATTPR